VTGDSHDQDQLAPGAVSLAARWYAKAREEMAASPSAPPGLAGDLAELGELNARLEAITAETEADAADTSGDPADYASRASQRAAERIALSDRQAAIMARVTQDPAKPAVWRQAAGTG
jgi:hypothetical protein